MAKFISTNKGWVNLDFVSEIINAAKQPGKGSFVYLLYGPEGESFGRVESDEPIDFAILGEQP